MIMPPHTWSWRTHKAGELLLSEGGEEKRLKYVNDPCVHYAYHRLIVERYGAVSRPDLKRRFPDLDPVLLKKLLCNIAELDTIGRR